MVGSIFLIKNFLTLNTLVNLIITVIVAASTYFIVAWKSGELRREIDFFNEYIFDKGLFKAKIFRVLEKA